MITSVSNSRVKRIVQLQEKGKARKQENAFIIEGGKLFLEAPDAMIREIWLTQDFLENCRQPLKDKLSRFPYETVSSEVFRKISDTQTPQGILCVLQQSHATFQDILNTTKENPPFLLLLEDIQDPGNLGTIFRTSEGAGADAIIMSRGCADIHNPKTIRSTMGSIFRVPFVYTDDLTEVIDQLKKAGLQVFAAHLKDARSYTGCDYRQGTAILIGNEGNGLKEETIRKAGQNIRIPMKGQVESLNAAASAAVLLYEVHRQRSLFNS